MKDTSLFEINRWIVIIDAKELCCSIGDVNKNVISGPRDCNTIAPKPITDRYDLDEFSVKWFFFSRMKTIVKWRYDSERRF